MKAAKKVRGTAFSIPAGLCVGVLVSITITLLGAALIAWLLTAERIGEGSIGYAAIVVLILAALSGSLTAVRMIKRLRLQVSMIAGICYFLSLLAVTALFFGGRYQAVGTTIVIVLLTSGAVALFPDPKRHSKKYRQKHYR